MGRDKATLVVEGQTLLGRTLSGVPEGIPVVVAGPEVPLSRAGIRFVRESPPGGGPVAGVDAALAHVRSPVFVLLATDLPLVGALPGSLAGELIDAGTSVDAVLATDSDGRLQQLCAAYRADAMRSSIAAGGEAAGASMHSVVGRLRVRPASMTTTGDATWHPTRDVDTPEELAKLWETLASEDRRGGTDG
jgi:molybdopterin-guanine dinucleotide biosynthesis protein A